MRLWNALLWRNTAHITLALFIWCGATVEEACDGPLVSNLPPSSFRSSSQLSSSHEPGFAKLNRREGAGGWSPLSLDRYQWLDVDLGGRTQITGVATQGRYGSSDWLTSYLLMFSDTGHNWKQYRQEDSIGAFPGNSNADSVVLHKLQQPVITRYLRLVTLDWNPNGRIGLRMETYGCPYNSDVAHFDGRSSLLYWWSSRRTAREVISLKFKTLWNSGILLHAEGHAGHALTLELQKGKLVLLLKPGGSPSPFSSSSPRADSRLLASLGSLLDDQHWHHVALERGGTHLNLTVDRSTQRVPAPPELTHWDLQQQLSVGEEWGSLSRRSLLPGKNFQGCVENLLYNGFNLVDLAKQKDQRVSVRGNVTFTCLEPISVAVTFTDSQSFLRLPGPADPLPLGGFSVRLRFRTWSEAGLLLTFGFQQKGGVIWLYMSKARLHVRVCTAGSSLLELSQGWGLNDGQWHSVELSTRRGQLTITVDKEEATRSSVAFSSITGSEFFFGGCPAEGSVHGCRNPFPAFRGCMRLLTINNTPVDLMKVQQRHPGSYSHLQIDMCGIIDRCSPSHCEHGGRCSQSWRSFHCNCSDTGYSGATCHTSVHERSCEAYKHNGNTSGYYYVDVDGSGPIRPQPTYCNMTEENTWTVIQHNNTELTKVRPGDGPHLLYFEYSSGEEVLASVLGQSERCEQELVYHCRKSRLLNTPEGSPFSWWVGGSGLGRVQTHWGGAVPGSHQCGCGLQGSCLDHKHYCNCDADRTEWANDSGLLTHKDALPVRSLVLGDVNRPGSEAAYKVGPLRCRGDKNLWNAAFFDKETSYLHFPTFHAELSADVSFLFKTTASSGVFLENLGIRDFVRIELNSSTQVLFSFDVGNGPLEVRVEASVPLNDDRWHVVRAERNVKEASLRLDNLPAARTEAPTDGHIRLQLNSQLFIGGTASRQKGFRGCIRSLQLNGVTQDLERRAKVTPGVQPGCPGHCSSYGSLCQNLGRCVERTNGFSCDCGLSAYTGTFCHTEVSASFKSGTSVRYLFPGTVEPGSNGSISSEVPPRGENISLSFRTSQSPALLLYVSSYDGQYLALLLNRNDDLEVRYKLDGGGKAEVLKSRVRNLANAQRHTLTFSRLADTVLLQIDQHAREDFNLTSDVEFMGPKWLVLGRIYDSDDALDPDLSSLGFSGCLSAVLFNSVRPLKAALLHPDSSPVSVVGPLVRCDCGAPPPPDPSAAETTHHLSDQSGSLGTGQLLVNDMKADSTLIGGVIAAVIFVAVSALAIVVRYLYLRKETFQSQVVKQTKPADEPELPISAQHDRHNVSAESRKEYFI